MDPTEGIPLGLLDSACIALRCTECGECMELSPAQANRTAAVLTEGADRATARMLREMRYRLEQGETP
jgi:ferredoxin